MFRFSKPGYVFRDYARVPHLPVMENESLPAMLLKDRAGEQVKKDSFGILCRGVVCATGVTTRPANSPEVSSGAFRAPGRW
jgi:predicted ABC-type transport system involved in lysophospholipase L1 biosynthesis ATPase subunit